MKLRFLAFGIAFCLPFCSVAAEESPNPSTSPTKVPNPSTDASLTPAASPPSQAAPSPTPEVSPLPEVSPSPNASETPSVTPSPTESPTPSPSPKPTRTPKPTPTPKPKPSPVLNPDTELNNIAEEFIRGFLAARPLHASALGFHEYDGRISEYTRLAIDAELARLKRFDERLRKFDVAKLGPRAAIDLRLLQTVIKRELFFTQDLAIYERNPMTYA